MNADQPIFTVSAVVEAPFEDVARLFLDVRPGPIGPDNAFSLDSGSDGRNQNLVLSGGPERFTGALPTGENVMSVRVDRARNAVIVEGQWWFRGECRVEPHPRGARLVQEGFNIATKARWAVPLVRMGTTGKQRAGAEQLVARTGERLGCRAYLE